MDVPSNPVASPVRPWHKVASRPTPAAAGFTDFPATFIEWGPRRRMT
jgi:hypothetical protein